MFNVGDLVSIKGFGGEKYLIDGVDRNQVHLISINKQTSGWVPNELIVMLKRFKKPETEVDFLDCFKNNFKDGV